MPSTTMCAENTGFIYIYPLASRSPQPSGRYMHTTKSLKQNAEYSWMTQGHMGYQSRRRWAPSRVWINDSTGPGNRYFPPAPHLSNYPMALPFIHLPPGVPCQSPELGTGMLSVLGPQNPSNHPSASTANAGVPWEQIPRTCALP